MDKNNPKILFVDDDKILLESFKMVFRKGYSLETCSSPIKALKLLERGKRYAVIISDMRMPGMDGIEFLRRAADIDGDAMRIMLTGYADLETAMAAVNSGKVSHFLTKPCPSANLKEAIDTCIVSYRDHTETEDNEEEQPTPLNRLIGVSEKTARLRTMIHRLGQVDATVLFTGESGTGKSLAAEILHEISDRKKKPFVRVNCPSLSPGVFGAELFGSVRGAYTGSVRDATGRFSVAEGGSILLDEIGDIPLEMQSKLLQVIERKEFERVGDHKTITCNVRIIAATNADLEQFVAQGKFRMDLFYRLNVMHLELSPLRERREDIPLLTKAFLAELAKQFGKQSFDISDNAMKTLLRHDWPGNIRELKHSLERGATLCSRGIIRTEDLPSALHSDSVAPTAPDGEVVSEWDILLDALKEAGWNKARAARKLGISRSSIYRRIKAAGIPNKEFMD